MAEIINYMILGSLTTGALSWAASSAYHGKLGALVMDKTARSLRDDPVARTGAVIRAITCEGVLRRGGVDLIRDGKLAGLMSNFYG